MNKKCMTFVAVVLLVASLAACSDREAPGEPSTTASGAGAAGGESRQPRTLPLPGEELPQGHPPLGEEGGAARLVWRVPAGWAAEEPASGIRFAQYRVPGPEGDGECVVFYFGPGQGGDPAANARRWAGQFSQPDGSSSLDLMKVADLESTAVAVQIVEVTGTYDGGMTMTDRPAEALPGYMLLGAIVPGPDAPWFFKLTGPEGTLRGQRDAFVGMLESIRPEG